MGLRRLRGRLDQLQGNANFTMKMAQDLLEDLQDGFGVSVEIDEKAVQRLLGILSGKAGTLPLKIKISPEIDA